MLTAMQENLREESQQQEAEVACRESKARPIMAMLEDLKRISIEVDFAIEIHLRERLHWDHVVTPVFLLGVFIFEAQVIFHGTPRIFCFVIDARTEG